MKKVFSILLASIILLSGMHLSISSHFCGGELASVKWSFSGAKASCGMEDIKDSNQTEKEITNHCCHNEEAKFIVDNNYCPSSIQIKELSKNVMQVFEIPVNISLQSIHSSNSFYSDLNPPDNLLSSVVNLSEICIFRI